jgi:HEAT repeat protein
MVQALSRAQGTLDPKTVQEAKQIISGALQDSDDGVRAFTVHALGKFGSEDMLPALKKVAEIDPGPEEDGHSIREQAADAIAAIQKRAAAIDPGVTPHR